MSFSPAVSKAAAKSMRSQVRKSGVRKRADLSLEEIAQWSNPILRGWIGYYGYYNRSAMESVMRHFNKTLVSWAMRKFEKLRGHKTKAFEFMQKIKSANPELFVHWSTGLRFA
jgi:hypothetical protein